MKINIFWPDMVIQWRQRFSISLITGDLYWFACLLGACFKSIFLHDGVQNPDRNTCVFIILPPSQSSGSNFIREALYSLPECCRCAVCSQIWRYDFSSFAFSSDDPCSSSGRQHLLVGGWRHGPVQCLQVGGAVDARQTSLPLAWPSRGGGGWHLEPCGRCAYRLPAWPLPSPCWRCMGNRLPDSFQQVSVLQDNINRKLKHTFG